MSGAPSRRAAIASMLLVVTIWGLNISVTKWTLAQFSPLAFTALRFLAATALLTWLLVRVEGPLRLPPGAFWQLVVLGVVGNTVYQLGFIVGLAHTTATNSALVLASMPAFVAALGAAARVEHPSRRGLQGLVLGLAGVVLVIAAQGVRFSGATLPGDLLTLAAVLCWAAFTLGVRRLRLPMSPLAITTWTMLTGGIPLVLIGLPSVLGTDWHGVTLGGWAGLAYSSAFSLVLAYVIWNRSVRVVGSNRTAIFACLTPVVATITAIALLGERPDPVQLVGGALVIAGVLLSQQAGPPGRPAADAVTAGPTSIPESLHA